MSGYQYKHTLDAGTTLVEGMLRIQRVNDRYVMSGGVYGDHSIATDSTEDRLRAHWSGYKENQR